MLVLPYNICSGRSSIRRRILQSPSFHQKYDSLEFKKKIYKTDLVAILRMFRRFNLIEPLGDVTKGSCDVIIYPTILLAVNNSNIDTLYNVLKSYESGEVADNEEAN